MTSTTERLVAADQATNQAAQADQRVLGVNVSLLAREGHYSGVWFAPELLKAAAALSAAEQEIARLKKAAPPSKDE